MDYGFNCSRFDLSFIAGHDIISACQKLSLQGAAGHSFKDASLDSDAYGHYHSGQCHMLKDIDCLQSALRSGSGNLFSDAFESDGVERKGNA